MKPVLIVIAGPTAIGKTKIAIEIAKELATEIISADSRQFFKEMNIGTAKPSEEEQKEVPHHFIGHKSIHDTYNASDFEFEAIEKLKDLFQKYDTVVMAGGSGMYIDAVCNGIDDIPKIDYEVRNSLIQRMNEEGIESLRKELKFLDPDSYYQIDLKNPKRILKALEVTLVSGKPYSSFLSNKPKERFFQFLKIALNREREELHDIINQRVDKMIDQGLWEEARSLYPHKKLNSLNTVGYKELFSYFDGNISQEEAIRLIKRDTRRYARRQITWLSRDQQYHWFHPDEKEKIWELLKEKGLHPFV